MAFQALPCSLSLPRVAPLAGLGKACTGVAHRGESVAPPQSLASGTKSRCVLIAAWLGCACLARGPAARSLQPRRRLRIVRSRGSSTSDVTFGVDASESATLRTTDLKKLAKENERLLKKVETGTATREEKKRLSRLHKGLKARAEVKEVEGTFMRAALREIGEETSKVHIRRSEIKHVLKKLESAEKVELLFMVDCTSSMAPHIAGVKSEIRNIAQQAMARSSGLDLQVGLLAYRDVNDGRRFETLSFTESFDAFSNFLSGIDAQGGADSPEDIMGALQLASGWGWQRPTRVLVHIADCPCHGREYHDLDDSYPSGDPNGIKAKDVLTALRQEGVDYYFGKLTDHTDKMINRFNEEVGTATADGTKSGTTGPYIEVLEASRLDKMVGGVSRAISESISATFEVVSGHRALDSAITVNLASHGSTGDLETSADVKLDAAKPTWSRLPRDKAIVFAIPPFARLLDVTDLSKGVIGIKRASPSELGKGAQVWMKIAEHPFAQGAQRYARWAQMGMASTGAGISSMTIEWSDMVVKDFKKPGKGGELPSRHAHQMENSAVASFLAQVYNKEARSKGRKKIDILRSYVIEVAGSYYSLEKPLPPDSEFVKYSSNSGYWNTDKFSASLGDFCKWTFQATGGYLIVSDLQGVELGDRFVLTDPAILCKDLARFGATNLGVDFMERVLKGLTNAEKSCGSA